LSAEDQDARDRTPARRRGVPGSYRRVYSPRSSFASLPRTDPYVARDIDQLVGALEQSEPLPARELAAKVGARRWGPGSFARAMREGMRRGIIERAGRNRYRLAPQNSR
jgi:predicted transcriptional regulator